ncbi:thiol peroxidase [Hydromonas duriensis]|uniref:Thiol peroxidase n=1 Tax=Hydromonas duriensis TaxID=1527608 RepID=A0A4V3DK35_9BURK|nr:thiol peroxidase [Hydromonas duriensis]TDR32563.1 thiol peroxidase (atypical 2-Cys peroxiredoxin) [Hydromonas duriensis]
MAQVLLRGNPVDTVSELPAVGSAAPAFQLTNAKLEKVTLAQFAGKKVVISIFPSIDTPTCATSTRKFNEQAASKADVTVLTVSEDLPFALGRFCGAEGIENVHTLSAFRSTFGKDYGVEMAAGPLAGLTARAVVVVDEAGKVIYTELVNNVSDEPNYEAALTALN